MGPVHRTPLILLLVSAATLFLLLLGRTTEAALDPDTLELVWYDEFVGDAVDWDRWIVDEGEGCDVGLCDWGNGEKQYYRSENAAVSDGALIITAQKEDFSSRFYTSSKLTSKNKYFFRYGRVEARIKLPVGGQGLWPAFWMMPQDNVYGKWAASGEIDIFESRNNFTEVVNNLNFGNAFPNNSNYNNECFRDVPRGTLEEYHTYAVEWDEEEFVWFMDGNETCRRDEWFSTDVKTGESRPKPAPFDQTFYLVLNMALGGNDEFVGSGPVDDSVLPATMTVDWVRVYQSPEQFGEGPRSVYLGEAVGGGSRQGVLTWGDDFNSSEVSADWEIVTGEACLGAEILCDAEIQDFHTPATAVEGGVLSITADGSVMTTAGLTSATSGLLHTDGSFTFMYGRLEANLSAPMVAGVVSTLALHTAATAESTGQIDVVTVENGVAMGRIWYPEQVSSSSSSLSAGLTGSSDYEAPLPLSSTIGSNSTEGYTSSSFYSFAIEWTEDRIRWYSDGRVYNEVTRVEVVEAGGSWPFDEEMYVSVGLTVGRALNGSFVAVDKSLLPATLQVGSIRAHQYADMEGMALPASATRYEREGNLTWQDEFDGVELDEASAKEAGEGVMGLEYWWQHEEGDGCEMGICGFGNGEAQWYRKENTAVYDGKLVVTAKAEPYAGNIYTSAKLSTKTTVIMSYGRIETRVKLPSAQGLWPSIWMLPHDSPYGGWASGGAIDILQARNEMSRAHGQLVFGGAYPDVDTLDLYQGGHCFSDMYEDFSEDYHVFALEWEVDAFRWYIDGVLYCERNYWYSRPGPGEDDFPFPAPFDTGFYLIINVAVGGGFTGGPIDEDALAEEPSMLVDYVRIYTLEGQSVFVADPPDPEASSGNGPGSVVSVVTAVSVLIVLAILFSICLIANCIAKRMGKKTDDDHMVGGRGITTNNNNHHADDNDASVSGPANADITHPVKGKALSLSYSKRDLPTEKKAKKKTYLVGTTTEPDEAVRSKETGLSSAAAVGGGGGGGRSHGLDSRPGDESDGTANGVKTALPLAPRVPAIGSLDPASRKVGERGSVVKSPVWGRGVGANALRKDVTPSRVVDRQHDSASDDTRSSVGDRSGRGSEIAMETFMKKPKLPSGNVPDEWMDGDGAVDGVSGVAVLGEAWVDGDSVVDDISSVAVAEEECVRGDSMINSDPGSVAKAGGGIESYYFSSPSIGGGSPVGGEISSVDVAIHEGGRYDQTGLSIAVSTCGKSGSGSVGGFNAGVGGVRGAAVRRGQHGRTNSFTRSASVCSDESEMPPSMHALTLDTKTIDDEEDLRSSGLPSYTEAVASTGAAYL